jgi:serine/threonine protein kinase
MAGVSEMPLCGNGVLGGRYALGEVIGRGGMAEVYRAWDQVLERSVAVKMLRVSASDPADRARFARETSTLATLNHPGLVTVLDAGTVEDRPFLVMELVDGAALSSWVRVPRSILGMWPRRVRRSQMSRGTSTARASCTGM